MSENKIVRVGSSHPDACKGSAAHGPCDYQKVGGDFCPVHDPDGKNRASRKALKNYQLNLIHAERANRMAGSSRVKDLSDELAIARMALEVVVNSCNAAVDLVLVTDKIDKLVMTISKLVAQIQTIQERGKELMGPEEVHALFDKLTERLIERVKDPETIGLLASDMADILKDIGD